MKITIISGSHRQLSQSAKVAGYIQGRLQQLPGNQIESDIFSLAGNPLPLWDQGVWEGDPRWSDCLDPLRASGATDTDKFNNGM